MWFYTCTGLGFLFWCFITIHWPARSIDLFAVATALLPLAVNPISSHPQVLFSWIIHKWLSTFDSPSFYFPNWICSLILNFTCSSESLTIPLCLYISFGSPVNIMTLSSLSLSHWDVCWAEPAMLSSYSPLQLLLLANWCPFFDTQHVTVMVHVVGLPNSNITFSQILLNLLASTDLGEFVKQFVEDAMKMSVVF